jgi:predicted outer membrane protein
MRAYGWAMGGVLCAFAAGDGEAFAAATPREGPPAAPVQDGATERGQSAQPKGGAAAGAPKEEEAKPITDDVIVEVMLKTERVVHRTAAVGTRKASGPGVHDAAKQVQADTGQMLSRLASYAARKGYTIRPVISNPADAEVERSVNAMLSDLQALDAGEFNPTFLVMMHDLCGQMLELLDGAQHAAADPALKSLLRERAARLQSDQKMLEVVMLRQPSEGGGPGGGPTRNLQ